MSVFDGLRQILWFFKKQYAPLKNQDNPKQPGDNIVNIGKDVSDSVVISGDGNTVIINSSVRSEKIQEPLHKQTPRKIYAVIILIAFVIGGGLLFIKIRRIDSYSKISGCVKDADNKPLKDVDVNLPNCLLVRTGDDGCFKMQIPPECQKEKITLTASKDDYDNWTGSAHPETGQEIGIVMNRKES